MNQQEFIKFDADSSHSTSFKILNLDIRNLFMGSDYQGKKLQGHSFRHKDLTGADFSYADIRGVNFTRANLKGANFSHAIAGVSIIWFITLEAGSLLLSAIAGLIVGFASIFPGLLLSVEALPGKGLFITGGFGILAVFLVILIYQGVGNKLGIVSMLVAILTAILAISINGEGEVYESILGAIVLQPLSIAFAIVGVLMGTIAFGIPSSFRNWWGLSATGISFLLSTLLGGMIGGTDIPPSHILISASIASLEFLVLLATIFYIVFCALARDRKYFIVNRIIVFLCSTKGTNFYNADLTEADFTEAKLDYTNFKEATLKRTCWFQVENLHLARLERTYLEDTPIRQLVVSKDGKDKLYDYKNLRELNLQKANLTNASLIGVDLSETTLQNADLTRAKLVQARLYGTELTYATLTGACIQDWAISTDTQLNSIKCEFIYMRLPTKDDPDPWRKPDNRNEIFNKGDFTDFIAPIIKTLDLYHQQNVDFCQITKGLKSLDFYHYGGIDPTAAAIALKQVAEENPEANLEVVALEGRGSEKVRLQAVVAGSVDSSQLNAKYFEKYHEISSLSYSDLQTLLIGVVEKDERIQSLEKLLKNALQQPRFYVETYQNQGEFIMSQSKGNVNINGVQGSVSGVVVAGESQTMTGVAIGSISGSVTNTINQLPSSSDPNSPGIKELLAQLQAAIEAETQLPDEDKAEALEQVKTLAEAGQKPEDNVLQKAAKTSLKILKGTVASLPDAATLAESCVKLLPAIATLLALV